MIPRRRDWGLGPSGDDPSRCQAPLARGQSALPENEDIPPPVREFFLVLPIALDSSSEFGPPEFPARLRLIRLRALRPASTGCRAKSDMHDQARGAEDVEPSVPASSTARMVGDRARRPIGG